MQLYPHQQTALEKTAHFNRVAYYLDMGLGKTFVGSEKANSFPEKIVLVCQKSKIDDWVNHFREHYSFTVFDLTNKKQLEEFTGTIGKCVGVINYDLVFRRSYFAYMSGFTLMLDESSNIQNETAKRSKFILKMKPENVILLSAHQQPGNMKSYGRSFVCLAGISAKTCSISSMLKWNGLRITTVGSKSPTL